MKRRAVGKTGLQVTEIGFGAAGLGNLYRAVTRKAANETLEAAWEAGMRYFDTAPYYGVGLSERRVGDFLHDKPRSEFVISTKVGRRIHPVPHGPIPFHGYVDTLPFRPEYDYTYDGIMHSLESSYARLGLASIDILFVHDIGVYTHGEEGNAKHFRDLMESGIKALDELRSSGVIKAYGLGVNESRVILDVMKGADLDVCLLAGRYSLLDRTSVAELLPECIKRQVSLVIGGVFNSGILATGAVEGAHFDYMTAPPEILERVRGMETVAARHGILLSAAAMQFPFNHPAVASVLVGTSSPDLLHRNLDALKVPVPEAAWAEFEPFTLR
jgi:D-threo-aldose 1-dehydrogenase